MNTIIAICTTLLMSIASIAQNALYIKYEYDIEIESDRDDADMMQMLLNGATLEVASNSNITWSKSDMGSMMTMERLVNISEKHVTIYMTGMMGNMAYEGDLDELKKVETEEQPEIDVEFDSETKIILNISCKKAIITDEDGNKATYWYTEEIEFIEGIEQMPNQIPGMCLQFEVINEGVKMICTAIELDKNANINDYTINIPEDVEVKSLEEMTSMGAGGM